MLEKLHLVTSCHQQSGCYRARSVHLGCQSFLLTAAIHTLLLSGSLGNPSIELQPTVLGVPISAANSTTTLAHFDLTVQSQNAIYGMRICVGS